MQDSIYLEQVSKQLSDLASKVDFLSSSVSDFIKSQHGHVHEQHIQDEWMDVDELIAYLPQHPSKSTLYRWKSEKILPYYKNGKTLTFKKSEIDEWLLGGYHKTVGEIENEADHYMKAKSSRYGK